MELGVVRDLVVGTSGPLLGLDSTNTAPDLVSLRQANLWREMTDGTSRAAFHGNCHNFLVWYSPYLFVIGTLAYIEHMVVPAVVGVRGSKEFWLYPSTTASVWIGGRVMMLLFSESMG